MSRGNMLVSPAARPLSPISSPPIVWFDENALMPGRSYIIRTETDPARSPTSSTASTSTPGTSAAKTLDLNEIGSATSRPRQPIAFDPYAENRDTGAFILIDRITNATVGAGMVLHPLRRATNIHRQALDVGKRGARRPEAPEAGGAVVHRAFRLRQVDRRQPPRKEAARGRQAHLHCSTATMSATGSTAISASPRPTASRTSAASREVAKLMADAGLIVLVLVHLAVPRRAPLAREIMAEGEFVEVFVDTPDRRMRSSAIPRGSTRRAARRDQANWNLQCAECHSTNLRKGYDAASNTYKTTFNEINVACEACHGPGSRHTEWAKQAGSTYSPDGDKGLVVLKSRWNEAWKSPAADAKHAQRDKPADAAAMNTCAACHARRSTIAETGTPGAPLEDTHRLALLTPPNYYADGQQREEVYVWNSFLQTGMYQKGVTCMDCHDAHTLKLRAEGNALCTRCHNAALFDTDKHHFHKTGTTGAQCVECHMPAQNYMVIDARRDHSMRVPRPDLSKSLGSPNACTRCHAGKKPEWAASAMDKWYGKTWRARPQYGTTLHAAATQGVKAVPALMALAQDQASPAIVRATAATLAQPYMRPDLLPAARMLLQDADPEVRIAALGLIEPVDPVNRVLAASSLLADPVRGVRIAAAHVLADVPDEQIPAARRDARERALKEYVDSLQQELDWPTANVNLGNLYMRQGRSKEAIAAYQRALSLDPRFAGAYVNLADAYRQLSRDTEGEKVLRRGLVAAAARSELAPCARVAAGAQGRQCCGTPGTCKGCEARA